ncbi:MAG: glycogen debranching enzyme N-terminal domain-containing protein [Lentisphaeria bacterium]|nr:glycogen debranching enzyme N-terminal domain-containing protein [Lentisphaeria bacterium]
MKQTVFPDKTIFHAGDTVTFRLEGLPDIPGKAVLRTNLGRAELHRTEIIQFTQKNKPILNLDWHDIELERRGDHAEVTLPLLEVGVFEAKCCFIPTASAPLLWPEGDNIRLKVESAVSVTGNTIYSAFVRQFGANRELPHSPQLPENLDELDKNGYVIIPPSGTFRQLKKQLDHIFGTLGCRILQLLPVHPTPVNYGRMGRYGSPFAATDYFNVDPALADFDVKATPMEQFGELIDAVHARDGRIFMDIPVNHTGWASRLQTEHPEYFVRREDGTFESPGAWGIVWADLCKLDYQNKAVHDLMAEVFLFWSRRGVDGFRCDAGYMLPADAWRYIVARVRQEYPDTIFLLEGLGGKLSVQEELLGSAELNWGYSELFQNYSRDEISRYFPYEEHCSHRYGMLVNFSETHDNNRLAATSQVYARLRFAVAALLCASGGFGFANGAEFFAAEKIDVHGCGGLNWGSEPNLNTLIRKFNILLSDHDAFAPDAAVRLIQCGPGNCIAALRQAVSGRKLLVLLNCDCSSSTEVHWPLHETPRQGRDILENAPLSFREENGCLVLPLPPGGFVCAAFDDYTLPDAAPNREPARVTSQRADAEARKVICFLASVTAAGKAVSPGKELLASPETFARTVSGRELPPVTRWREEADPRRLVMLPPKDLLLLESPRRFRAEIRHADRTVSLVHSLRTDDGRHIAFVALKPNNSATEKHFLLEMVSFDENGNCRRSTGKLLQLADGKKRKIRLSLPAAECKDAELRAFAANNTGGISFFPVSWGTLRSKYDAILSGNIDPSCPVDRHTMFTRCRAWINVHGYSQEIDLKSLENFTASPDNRGRWLFRLPAGQGRSIGLEITFSGAISGDAVRFVFRRLNGNGQAGELDDATPVRLILRPDVEDRINHHVTKAFNGPEHTFPAAVKAFENGFDFAPAERLLRLEFGSGKFHSEPEWHYMTDLPAERYYGMEDKTDLFSPGYFDVDLCGGEEVILTAVIDPEKQQIRWPSGREFSAEIPPQELYENVMRRFVVKRDELNTVIAGYPWFLDWGRDTLIVLRGLLQDPFRKDAEAIIRQFASFEENGTIPNIIHGRSVGNRDTSDAPLYLIIAARDCIAATGNAKLLKADCNGRTLKAVLLSIVENYIKGTPNGIKMDEESGLVFSPSHFTWMDTNYPAGTPRQGYPIEIQSLWYAALEFLGKQELAQKVSESIEKYYFTSGGCASDCLHSAWQAPARDAVADDHIRPNQLTAITFGAVKDKEKQRRILAGCEELIVPGGIRSLADRPVNYRLPVEHHGHLLNDPGFPYKGIYCGPEDTSRKVSYHNGTVWSWPFFNYCEALVRVGGKSEKSKALALLMSAAIYFENGVIGQMPEVADGNAPHRPGGCLAQAWSASEFFRVLEFLKTY